MSNSTTNGQAAVFSDVEGTLISISFPRTYLEQARAMGLVPPANLFWMGLYTLLGKFFSAKSKIGGVLRYLSIMSGMRNVPVAVNPSVMAHVNPMLHASLKPKPLERIRHYEAQGMPVILISASLQPGVESFAATFGWRGEGTRPVVVDGVFTGQAEKPLTGEEKAVRLRELAQSFNLDLSRSVGFGDTITDVPFLSLLATAHVVDPDDELRALAVSKGWTIIES